MSADRIQQIADETETERSNYLDYAGWDDNPFAHPAGMDEYVIPSEGTVADIVSYIRDNTGPILIHSEYSGIGKTTLLDMLLESLSEEYSTAKIGEHNVTAYELTGILADRLGMGKSSSTKLTEARLRESLADRDSPVIVGIDEFGLNNPDTIHTVQYLNDLPNTRVVLTGMTSQWRALSNRGSEGKAFARRVSHETQLDPLSLDQTRELVERRVANVSDQEFDGVGSVDITPIADGAVETVHENSNGVPAVATAALSTLVTLAAAFYSAEDIPDIDADLADRIDYSDPEADVVESEDEQ